MVTANRPDLKRLSDVRTLLSDWDFHPSRALGQNFLVDGNILDILIGSAGVSGADRILEVGPGLGVVTEVLLARGAFVVAVEKDHRLFDRLQERLGDGDGRLELIEGDALELSVPLVKTKKLNKVVSNLPYNPGSRILVDLICADPAPSVIVITVQLEVGERLTTAAGSKAYGLLGVWCQLHYQADIVKVVSPNCFWPKPAIKSAIVRLERRVVPLLPDTLLPFFYELTRYAFQHRRKQLASILSKAPSPLELSAIDGRAILGRLGILPSARPEELSVEQWCAFAVAMRVAQALA